MLEIKNLHIGYNNKTVANDINARLLPGELISLLGPNGTGKSTLLKTVAGLIKRLSGEISFEGKEISDFSPREKAKIISVVLTEPIGVGNFSVIEVLSLGRYPYKGWWGKTDSTDLYLMEKALDNTKIQHLAHRQIAELSDGEKQKVMIARALSQDTDFILLDEPTSHLDLPSKIEVMALLKELAHKWKKAILVSTHDLNLAIQAADKFWLINKAGNFDQGTNEDLILKGALNECFEMENNRYNFSTGKITFPSEQLLSVAIKGKGPQYVWTRHAFERMGYRIVEESNLNIESAGNERWILNYSGSHLECRSIEDLIRKMREMQS